MDIRERDMSRTILLCAGVFILTVAIGGGILGLLAREHKAAATAKGPSSARNTGTRTIIIAVTGVDCSIEQCASKVRQALLPVQGVRGVQVDAETKQARVSADSRCTDGALLFALRQAGFGGQIIQ
jgi:copper chaperone CopZ